MLNQARDDAQLVPDIGEAPAPTLGDKKEEGGGALAKNSAKGGSAKRKAIPLEELTRFTMVKRIW